MRKPFFAFAFRLGDVGTGKEAAVPNRMIEFEGFVRGLVSQLWKSVVFSSHFLSHF